MQVWFTKDVLCFPYNRFTVTFGYKAYSDSSKQKEMPLPVTEFIRRFEQHILPEHFTKIRTYGYLANRNRRQRINEVLEKMKLPLHKEIVKIPIGVRMMVQYGIDLSECPSVREERCSL